MTLDLTTCEVIVLEVLLKSAIKDLEYINVPDWCKTPEYESILNKIKEGEK